MKQAIAEFGGIDIRELDDRGKLESLVIARSKTFHPKADGTHGPRIRRIRRSRR